MESLVGKCPYKLSQKYTFYWSKYQKRINKHQHCWKSIAYKILIFPSLSLQERKLWSRSFIQCALPGTVWACSVRKSRTKHYDFNLRTLVHLLVYSSSPIASLFIFWLLSHFWCGQNRKTRSSSFLGLSFLRNHSETLATIRGLSINVWQQFALKGL